MQFHSVEIFVNTRKLMYKNVNMTLLKVITVYSVMIYQYTPNLGGDGELGDDDSDRVGVFGQLPGAGQLHHLLISVGGVGQ